MPHVKSDKQPGAIDARLSTQTRDARANGPAFYTVAQLADRWAITERQVRRYIATGELIATRFGRSVRVSAEEVARFEARCTAVK
jgi:excisionase family DNA binding protein